MNNTTSLVYTTDLIFHYIGGHVVDHGYFLCVRTPSNPEFRWGNYLLFKSPPISGDAKHWDFLFQQHISQFQSKSQHRVYGWIGDTGACEEFDGLTLSKVDALTSKTLIPPERGNQNIEIRAYQSDKEWKAAVELQIICRNTSFSEREYRPFKEKQFELYRHMESIGKGQRYGAFIKGQLVADLGIYTNGSLGRYNNVCTHPDMRKRGIAAQLVYAAGKNAQQYFSIQQLVIVTDSNDANRIYRHVGFIPAGYSCSLERGPLS